MKRIIGLMLLITGLSYGQTTAVTALVSDTSGTNWVNGSYTITFVPVPGNPGPYFYQGAPFVPQAYTGSMDAGGNLAITLPSSNFITPAKTQWKFTVCPQASSPCQVVNVGVTGATLNLTTTLSANNPPVSFPATPLQFGYNDAEAKPQPGLGQMYYNVNSAATRQWTGSEWQNVGGGGGSFSLTTSGTTGASTFSAGTLNIPVYQGQLSLTTTGSSGPATLTGNIINIPQYSGGGGGGVTSLNSLTGGLNIIGGANLTVTPSGSNITLVPNITGLVTPGTNVTITGSGTSGSPYVVNSSGGGGGSNAFSSLTAGTNNSAAMVVGSGASLTASGTGTIVATNGLTGQTPGCASKANTATSSNSSMPTCESAGVVTISEPTVFTGSGPPISIPQNETATPSADHAVFGTDSSGNGTLSNNGATPSLIATSLTFASPPAIGNTAPAPSIASNNQYMTAAQSNCPYVSSLYGGGTYGCQFLNGFNGTFSPSTQNSISVSTSELITSGPFAYQSGSQPEREGVFNHQTTHTTDCNAGGCQIETVIAQQHNTGDFQPEGAFYSADNSGRAFDGDQGVQSRVVTMGEATYASGTVTTFASQVLTAAVSCPGDVFPNPAHTCRLSAGSRVVDTVTNIAGHFTAAPGAMSGACAVSWIQTIATSATFTGSSVCGKVLNANIYPNTTPDAPVSKSFTLTAGIGTFAINDQVCIVGHQNASGNGFIEQVILTNVSGSAGTQTLTALVGRPQDDIFVIKGGCGWIALDGDNALTGLGSPGYIFVGALAAAPTVALVTTETASGVDRFVFPQQGGEPELAAANPVFSGTHAYSLNDLIFDGTNVQKVTTAGTSGGSAPTWNVTAGGTTTTGGAITTNIGPVTSFHAYPVAARITKNNFTPCVVGGLHTQCYANSTLEPSAGFTPGDTVTDPNYDDQLHQTFNYSNTCLTPNVQSVGCIGAQIAIGGMGFSGRNTTALNLVNYNPTSMYFYSNGTSTGVDPPFMFGANMFGSGFTGVWAGMGRMTNAPTRALFEMLNPPANGALSYDILLQDSWPGELQVTSTGILNWIGTLENNGVPLGSQVSGLTAGYIPKAGTATTITSSSALDDGITNAGAITSSEPIFANFIGSTTPQMLTLTPELNAFASNSQRIDMYGYNQGGPGAGQMNMFSTQGSLRNLLFDYSFSGHGGGICYGCALGTNVPTGLKVATGNLEVDSLTTAPACATAGVLADCATTGTGSVVRATSPTLVTPALGTPSAAVLTNATGLPAASVVAGALANGMTATTQTVGDSTTKVATDAFVLANAAVYPGAGIPNSTGSAWGTSYTASGGGVNVATASGALNNGHLASWATSGGGLDVTDSGLIAPLSNAITSATAGTGITSVTCATATCTNQRGTYTVVGGTATTGTIITLVWPTTTSAYVCTANQNDTGVATAYLGLGHSVATATGMTISAGISVIGTTFNVDYSCIP